MHTRPGHAAITPVAVGIVHHADGRVLLAQRPPGKAWAGYWEFPGGKIEPGESPAQALARELHEELGIDCERVDPWITRDYAYPEKRVRLHFFRVPAWHGTPHGREGQALAWEAVSDIRVGPLLPANAPVLQALALPPLYAITRAGHFGVQEFLGRLERALERGVRLVQVREPGMAPAALAAFARAVVERAHARGARVLVNGDVAQARAAGADGVHLPARQLMALDAPPEAAFWATSCHDAAELDRAAALGASFAVLSPVLPTASHPGQPGMGWERFATLARTQPMPVYALGGMKPELLDTATQHGAHGIALLSGIW
jgi:8-oxo-dGTP diphosphatase